MITIYNSIKTDGLLPAYQRGDTILYKAESLGEAEKFIESYLESLGNIKSITNICFGGVQIVDVEFKYSDGTEGEMCLGYIESQ